MPGRNVDPRFGERLRELMRQRETSYRALAARTYQSSSALHRLATSQTSPAPDLARLVDVALDAGGELLALVAAEPPAADATPAASKTGHVLRRDLLTDLLAALVGLGMGQATERSTVGAFITSLTGRDAEGSTSVDEWQQIVWEYGFTYSTQPRAALLADLTADLATVTTLTDRVTTPTTLAGLNDAAAHLAGLVAMVCIDLGYRREARHSWLLARRRATASKVTSTRLWLLGQEALLGLYSERPLQVMLDLAERGLSTGRNARVGGVAHLYGARAQALALLNRGDDAVEALHALADTFEQLPGSVTDRSGSVFAWPEDRLHHAESFVHGVLGRTADAFEAQDRAFAVYPHSKAISRSQIHMHRAACLVRAGDVDVGVGHATSTLEELPGHARGHYVLTVAQAVLDVVPPQHRQRSAVREYGDLVTTARTNIGM